MVSLENPTITSINYPELKKEFDKDKTTFGEINKLLSDTKKSIDINSIIIEATKKNDLELIKFLVTSKENDVDINLESPNAFEIAIKNQNLSIVKYFLGIDDSDNFLQIVIKILLKKLLKDINCHDGQPLIYAITTENKDKDTKYKIIKLLLEHRADPNIRSGIPLIVATKYNEIPVIQFLLERGANSQITNHKINPFDYTINIISKVIREPERQKYISVTQQVAVSKKILEIFLKHGADINYSINPLTLAVQIPNKTVSLDMIKFLMDRGADVKKNDGEILELAIIEEFNLRQELAKQKIEGYDNQLQLNLNSSRDIIRLLVNHQDMNVLENKFIIASRYTKGEFGILEIFIKHGVNIHFNNEEAIRTAILNKDLPLIKFLHGIDPKIIMVHDNEPLFRAIETQDINTITLILKLGADINAHNSEALIKAIELNNKDIVDLLLSKGINVNAQDSKSLIVAINIGDLNIIELLLNKNVNLHAQNNKAFYTAVDNSKNNIIDLLLNRGIDINMDNGLPLKIAIKNNSIDTVKKLLDKGAILQKETFDTVNKDEQPEVKKLLHDWLAKNDHNTLDEERRKELEIKQKEEQVKKEEEKLETEKRILEERMIKEKEKNIGGKYLKYKQKYLKYKKTMKY